jgi:transcriptional regulator with XRE-family HTH domain
VSPRRLRRLSTVVKKMREEQGLTQAQLAKKAGVTGAYVSMIESGVRKNPSLPRALGVPVGELLE